MTADRDQAAASIYDRAVSWRDRYKADEGSVLAIHLREPEEIIDGLLAEAQRVRRVIEELGLAEQVKVGLAATR